MTIDSNLCALFIPFVLARKSEFTANAIVWSGFVFQVHGRDLIFMFRWKSGSFIFGVVVLGLDSRHSGTLEFTISIGKFILVCRYARKRTHFIVGILRFYVFVVMDFEADVFKGCCFSKYLSRRLFSCTALLVTISDNNFCGLRFFFLKGGMT